MKLLWMGLVFYANASGAPFVPRSLVEDRCVSDQVQGVGWLVHYSGPSVPVVIDRKDRIRISENCWGVPQSETVRPLDLLKGSVFELTAVRRKEVRLRDLGVRAEEIHFELANNRVLKELVCRHPAAENVLRRSRRARVRRKSYQCYLGKFFKNEPFSLGRASENPKSVVVLPHE
jgi:hypothetical protein